MRYIVVPHHAYDDVGRSAIHYLVFDTSDHTIVDWSYNEYTANDICRELNPPEPVEDLPDA